MKNPIPCFLADSDEARLLDAADTEDESPLTHVEKRISWICDEWESAVQDDTYDTWHDVRMAVFGAVQTLIYCNDRFEDSKALQVLGDIAFEHGLDCIKRGKYEGAPA